MKYKYRFNDLCCDAFDKIMIDHFVILVAIITHYTSMCRSVGICKP